jgi:cyanophycin synthetase
MSVSEEQEKPKHRNLQCCFQLHRRKAGVFAAEEAVKIAESLIAGTDYDINSCIQTLKEIRERERLGPSTGSIVEEAASRRIPWIRLGKFFSSIGLWN